MSQEFKFNKEVKINKIQKLDSLKIQHIINQTWIIDEYGNSVLINKTNPLEIISYNNNNPKKIVDSLVDNFNICFITDKEMETIFTNGGNVEFDKLYEDTTVSYGYVKEGDSYKCPNRNEDDYKPTKSKFVQD